MEPLWGKAALNLLSAALIKRFALMVLKEGEAADHRDVAHRAEYYALVVEVEVEATLGVVS